MLVLVLALYWCCIGVAVVAVLRNLIIQSDWASETDDERAIWRHHRSLSSSEDP